VTLSLSEATLCLQEPGEQDIPRDHELIVASVSHQTIGAFSVETDPVTGADKVRMEGKVQQRLECRPFADKSYLQLKVEEMKKVSEPIRKLIQLDRVVQVYKPIADHKHNVRNSTSFPNLTSHHSAFIYQMLKTLRDSYSYVTYNILLYLFISDRI
jgi:transcription initiation factor TFIIF subunit beta